MRVSLYAQLIGELMFIAINTQPLIAQPVNALARFMTTANSELYVLAKGVLRYLKGVKSRKIVWCASRVKVPFVPCVTLRDAKTGIKDRYEPGM